MPQLGESPLARMAQAILEGNGYALGTPSPAADGASVIVPVLRTRRRARSYVLACEVADSVSALDPGRIDRLRVMNESSDTVFLPPGSVFDGGETASRGTTLGVLLGPESTAEVEVRDAHSSRAMQPGAVLRLAESAPPDRVRQALLSRDQGLVWSAVRGVIAARGDAQTASDDLVSVLRPREGHAARAARSRPSAASTAPCGAIVLNAHGVTFAEVFDSPESWEAAVGHGTLGTAGESVSRDTHSRLASFAPDLEAKLAKEFLDRLRKGAHRRITLHVWTGEDFASECTIFGNEVIHLIAFDGDPWAREASVASAAQSTGSLHAVAAIGTNFADEGEVAVAQIAAAEIDEEIDSPGPGMRPRRRKVLTSGWDAPTFESLERYTNKEFGGDRSAALRFLARQGLRRRGYMGPRPPATPVAFPAADHSEELPPRVELGRAAAEARIYDFERIARTDTFAEWLRARARLELERVAASAADDSLRGLAQSVLERFPPPIQAPATEDESIEEAVPAPLPPPVDTRPLLRRAFSASAAGQFSDALRLLDEVLDTEPENRTALLGRAVALRRSGKAQESLAALDVVLRLEPQNAAALLNRGRVLQEMGDLQEALETFDRLAAVAPNDWDVWVARGDVLTRMDRVHDALDAYAEAARRNPDDESLNAKIRGLERTRPPPPPTPAARAALPREIQESQSYLVKEPQPDLSYRMLRSLIVRSVPALVVARLPPDRVRAEHALQGVPVLQLTHEPGEDRVPPTSLASLTNTLERFVIENHGRAAILLDGLSLLVESNGFRDTALFLERVNEAILPSHAVFLVCVAPGDLEDKEAAILERDLRVLT